MTYPWLIASGIYGFLGVAMGAFATHSLAGRAGERTLNALETGADYALLHAAVLLALGLFGARLGTLGKVAGTAFTFGVALFSGSLFVYGLTGITAHLWITPLGGAGLLLGWALVPAIGLKGALAGRDSNP